MSGDFAEIFSRKMRAGGINETPIQRHIAATKEECVALAAALNLPAIAALEGDFTLAAVRGHGGGAIGAEVRLSAKLTQVCVVTLEPFDSRITDEARIRFVPAERLAEGEAPELTPETLDDPDELPYTADAIDLGAALAEQLALALDPYPRKPGAELPASANDASANPFSGLSNLGKPAND